MPRAFSDFERERLRGRLIEAGKRAINRSGTRALVVDEVTREAGISKGSFYSFFSSKEDFVLSVLEDWENRYRSELFAILTEGSGSATERFEQFFSGIRGLFDREPGLAKLGFVDVLEIMDRLPPERLATHQANDESRIAEAARSWVDAGLIEATDLPAIPGLLDALFVLAMHRDDFRPGAYEPALQLLSEALAQRLAQRG